MTESQRHNALLELLNNKGSITVSNVIDQFGVSPATARRDINKLDEKGKLKKVRNGAEAMVQKRPYWSPVNIRETLNHDEKKRIARVAAEMCSPGDSIVINSGSTAFLLGKEICGRDIQVITNYFPLMSYLIGEDHDGVVIVGGQYHKTRSLILAPHQEMTSFYSGHYMFTSGTGLTAEGLYKMDMLSAMAEQKMLNQVSKLVALVDSSKLGQKAGILFASAKQIDVVITGEDADPEVVKELEEQGIYVVLA